MNAIKALKSDELALPPLLGKESPQVLPEL